MQGLRRVAVVLALLVVGCGDDADPPPTTVTTTTLPPDEGDGTLQLAAEPEVADAVRQAVDDVNAAGGVLGRPVELVDTGADATVGAVRTTVGDWSFTTLATPDLVAQALADLVADGPVGVVDRGGADEVVDALDPAVVGTVDDVLADPPDVVVLAGPGDPAPELVALIDGGYPPAEHPVYLVGGDGEVTVGRRTGALEGMRALVPGADPPGSEVDDAVTLVALAAEAAGTDDPTRLALALPGLTRDGATCLSFAECRPLVADGEDVAYEGPGGRSALDDQGDPTSAVVTVLTYAADDRVDPNRTEYVVANS